MLRRSHMMKWGGHICCIAIFSRPKRPERKTKSRKCVCRNSISCNNKITKLNFRNFFLQQFKCKTATSTTTTQTQSRSLYSFHVIYIYTISKKRIEHIGIKFNFPCIRFRLLVLFLCVSLVNW